MRKAEREIKDQRELEDVIRRAEVCRLAMIDDGVPYIVPMNFGYRDGTFYFHCAREGRKLDILRKHPRVCFELEADVRLAKGGAPCKWSTSYESVIGWGVGGPQGAGGPDVPLHRGTDRLRPPLHFSYGIDKGKSGKDDRQAV